MLSVEGVVRLQAYGMDSLQVLVVPVPVAATVLDSPKKTGLVEPSIAETSAEQIMLEMLVVLSVIVSTTVIVPVNVVAAAGNSESSVACGTERKAPVCGSRNPRIP